MAYRDADKVISRIGITPVGSAKYRVNRLRFHLLAYAITRKFQLAGKEAAFFIRCDDTDSSNVNLAFLDSYLEVLFSLGVVPNLTPYDKDSGGFSLFQSKRGDLYKMFIDRLLESGLAFKDSTGAIFFHTEEFSRRFQGLLTDNKLEVEDASIGSFAVDIRTPLKEKSGKIGLISFPLVRANGTYLFSLCSPVDDGVMGITHVVRDRDKLDLLSRQEMVRISLGFPSITYVHVPLLVNQDGKRFVCDEYWGDATFQDFVAKGIFPKALVSYLLSGFFGPSEKYYSSIEDFASQINLGRLHQSNTVFDESVLKQHNKKALEGSSVLEYETALKNFLAGDNPVALDCLKSDSDMLEMMIRMKRGLSETGDIIHSLSQFLHDDPDIKHIRILNTIITFFLQKESGMRDHSCANFMLEMATEHAKNLGTSRKEYYKALRYILTGKYQGCDLHEVVGYLEKKGVVMARIKATRNELIKRNLLMESRSHTLSRRLE